MSNIEQIDFSTLTWVKTELDETLNRAKEALKTYVEDTDDTNQLQFCITYLHQIQGTLKMVELYGAAMVAEEMESVAKDLINGKITDTGSAYDVLMQSILQLPDYLERIELGHKDVPIVLLPLVNDLRAVRSLKLLSESALFNPNLDLGVPERIASNDVSLKGNQLRTALLKIRSVYQVSLLNWIKQKDTVKALSNIKLVVSKLQMILSPLYLKQLFWAYSGVLEGMEEGDIDDNVALKQIAGKVDLLIKELIDGSSHTKSSSRSITRNLLYYIAINKGNGRLTNEVNSFFDLKQFIPDEADIKHAEGSMTGKNRELLQTVSDAIKDDVLVVQESLDLFIRNKAGKAESLVPLMDNLQNIADTLGILGLGKAREAVIDHQKTLQGCIDDDQRPHDDDLMDVAKTLLQIEAKLGDHIQSLGASDEMVMDDENAIPQSEKRAILQQLAKESIINLQQVKTNFVAFIESPWDKNQVKDNPRLLKDISGALKILNLPEAGGHLEDIIEYINTDILASDSKPSAMELEQLATVISSLEYYLENLDQGQRIRSNLLEEVNTQIKQLQHHVANDSALRKADNHKEQTVHEEVTEQKIETTDENVVEKDFDPVINKTEVEAEAAPVKTEVKAVEQPDKTTTVSEDRLAVVFGDDVDDEIKEVFAEEFEEELANMQTKHAVWRKDPESSTEELGEIRRIFHTLKGSGRLVGAEAVGEFGWQLENMCNRMLEDNIADHDDFKVVLKDAVGIAGKLFVALQNNEVVPVGYYLVLKNAENVSHGRPLISAVEKVAESTEVESTEVESTEVESTEVESSEAAVESAAEGVTADTTTAEKDGLEIHETTDDELDLDLDDLDDLDTDEVADDQVVDEMTSLESIDEIDVDGLDELELGLFEDENDVENQVEAVDEVVSLATTDEIEDESLTEIELELFEDESEVDAQDAEIESVDDVVEITAENGDDDTEQKDEDDFMYEYERIPIEPVQDKVKDNSETEVSNLLKSESDESELDIDLTDNEEFDLERELAEMDFGDNDEDDEEDITSELNEEDEDGITLELNEEDEDDITSELNEEDEDDITSELNEEDEDDITSELNEDESFSMLIDDLDDEHLELNLDLGEDVEHDIEIDAQDEAINDLEVDPVFIEILQKEVGGHLVEMSRFISHALEQEQPKLNDDFVRVVHTLNGAASMATVDGITKMTSPLEKMSILMLDKNETLNAEDIKTIEQVIHHAKSQMNLLGTGKMPVDESIGNYFSNRIEQLRAKVEDSDDTEIAEDEFDEAMSDEFDDFMSEDTIEEDSVEEDLVEEDLVEEGSVEEESVEEESVEEESVEEESVEEESVEEESVEEESVEEESVEEDSVEEDSVEEDSVEKVASSGVDASFNPFQDKTDVIEDEDNESYESDLDDELLEIFSEEASEIFDRADHLLAELEESPNSPKIIQALQRDLHTLKGGARMAGLNQIGDLSHQLESLFEAIAEKNAEVNPEQQEMMSQIMHKLHAMVTSDDYGQLTNIETETAQLEQILTTGGSEIKEKSKLDEEFFDPLAQVDSPLSELATEDEDAELAIPKKKANVLSGGQIKVNSELLDKLVNFAGEVSIYRSRMEQQSAELKLNIDELENTVERVRRQLRELEHETEAQIISNYQVEGDDLEEDFDPLELDQFSTIQQLSRSLSESVSDLTNIQAYLQESARSSETLLVQQSRVNTELQEGLMETRLVTFNSLVPRLRRVLRTTSQELGKNAKLVVKGTDGEMDKTVLEGIQSPLEHMIRNAMVHGLEADRKALGKPEQGHVIIELSREATEVVITVKDDGAGINADVLRKKAIERGIIPKNNKLSDKEITQLITHSGLSAADKVTKLAGRGVGMDVVNNEIKRLGGSIEIISEKGVGSTFVIRLPYTLALTQAIIVQVADHRYAIPASGVEGLIRMNINEFRRRILENDLSYDYAGEEYKIQELNKLLNVDSEALVEGNQVPLVMIKSGDQGVALRVDQTYGGREIVVKSVGTQVASVPGIFGATILGDGAVVLILDIIPMHRAYILKLEKMASEDIQVVEEVEEEKVVTIMVVDDSITMRRAGERMLARNDFLVMTAKDGLDALNKLQEQKPDLMLLDIEMPRMDGFELATAMKQSERFKDIPIIMITSRTGQKHKDRAKEIGVERYLGKPYQELELLENINDLLQLEDA